MNIIFGYDPGGINANGVAILKIDSKDEIIDYQVSTVDSEYDAENWLNQFENDHSLLGVGIDSFLHWERRAGSSRPVDSYLRTLCCRQNTSSVMNSNSARGAMAIQGIIMALKLREKYMELIINETHPKVSYYLHTQPKLIYDYVNNKRAMEDFLSNLVNQHNRIKGYNKVINIHTNNDDEWDALYSAIFTFLLGPFCKKSVNDLTISHTSNTLSGIKCELFLVLTDPSLRNPTKHPEHHVSADCGFAR